MASLLRTPQPGVLEGGGVPLPLRNSEVLHGVCSVTIVARWVEGISPGIRASARSDRRR